MTTNNFSFVLPEEFNLLYGKSAYGQDRYKLVDKSDIGTYVAMKIDSMYPIHYFEEWIQAPSIKEFNLLMKDKDIGNYTHFHYISNKGIDISRFNTEGELDAVDV